MEAFETLFSYQQYDCFDLEDWQNAYTADHAVLALGRLVRQGIIKKDGNSSYSFVL